MRCPILRLIIICNESSIWIRVFLGSAFPVSASWAGARRMNLNEAGSRHLDTFLKHRDALVAYAAVLVGDRVRAEDVVQEAWLRFSAATGEDRGEGKPIVQPAAYLYRIVRNLAIDLSHRRRTDAAHPSSEVLLNEVPADDADPERTALDRDQLRALAAALEELPQRTRYAFDLHRFDEKTYSEIGEILGISQTRAYGLVQEALAHCMRRLGQGGRK